LLNHGRRGEEEKQQKDGRRDIGGSEKQGMLDVVVLGVLYRWKNTRLIAQLLDLSWLGSRLMKHHVPGRDDNKSATKK